MHLRATNMQVVVDVLPTTAVVLKHWYYTTVYMDVVINTLLYSISFDS